MAITLAGIKSVPVVGSFVSRIFSKSRYAKWKGRGWERYVDNYYRAIKERGKVYPWSLHNAITGKPLTAYHKKGVIKYVMKDISGWNKEMQADVRKHLEMVKVIPEPKPKSPVEVHKVSASYKPEATTKTMAEPGLFQAGISKIPIYVLMGIGALFIIPQLLRTRGGKE